MLSDNPDFIAVNQAFPHIGEKLKLYWGGPDFAPYMRGLLQDTRDGQRRGFPFDALMNLQTLSDLHKRAFPELDPPSEEIWIMNNPHLR